MEIKEKFEIIKKAHENGELVTSNAYLIQFDALSLNKFNKDEFEYALYFDKFKIIPLDDSEHSTIKKYRLSTENI
jgi:hypothetical protein